ncbi:hypothetical protein EDD16DRAFT_1657701 [Pisolithus croceorrhizus]|nr:hypothetical protein EDD16DRAFT_1657701 [Pisolithus croceorrhizus]
MVVSHSTPPVTRKKAPYSRAKQATEPSDVDEDMSGESLILQSVASVENDIGEASIPHTSTAPSFPPLPASAASSQRIPIPPHRMTPIKETGLTYSPHSRRVLGLQVRMNVQRRCVEIRTSKQTKEIGALQKGLILVKAYALGFDVNDAIALLRLDDLFIDSFEIHDVKTLHGDHLSRAIGRYSLDRTEKRNFTIENASRTRIKIHIMGSFQNIKIARDAIVSLILGTPPGKVYSGLRTVCSRLKQRAL